MPLKAAGLIAFTATTVPEQATEFYRDVLGLDLKSVEDTAIVFELGEAILRVSIVPEFSPTPYTVLGWSVDDIESEMSALSGRGVTFERFLGFPQDERGVMQFPDGTLVAWFKDPDGNVLSLTQF